MTHNWKDEQLCLQKCSFIQGMDLKLILYRTITISGKESLVIIKKIKTSLFVLLSRFQRISSHLYIKEWRPTSWIEHNTLQLIYKQYKNLQRIQTQKARLSKIHSSYSVIVLFSCYLEFLSKAHNLEII